jgi:hypothetical protein
MLFVPQITTKFKIKGSVENQIRNFNELRLSNPEKSKVCGLLSYPIFLRIIKELFENGEELVKLCGLGEFFKIRRIVDSCAEVVFL